MAWDVPTADLDHMLEAVERAREDQAKVKTHFESYKCEPCRVQALSAKDWTAFVTCSCRASRTLPGWLMRTRVRALPWNRGLRRLLRRSLPLRTHTCLLVTRRKRGQMHPQGVGVIRHKAEPVRTGPIIVRSDAVEFTAFAHMGRSRNLASTRCWRRRWRQPPSLCTTIRRPSRRRLPPSRTPTRSGHSI